MKILFERGEPKYIRETKESPKKLQSGYYEGNVQQKENKHGQMHWNTHTNYVERQTSQCH